MSSHKRTRWFAALLLMAILTGCSTQNKQSEGLPYSRGISAETSNQDQGTAKPPETSSSVNPADQAPAAQSKEEETSATHQSKAEPAKPVVQAAQAPEKKAESATSVKTEPKESVAATEPAEEKKASVKIVSVTSPAARNSTATLKAKVTPGASASITVNYKSGPSKAAGLESKKADAEGNVSWSWHVGGNTTLGSWPITISCNGVSTETSFEVIH